MSGSLPSRPYPECLSPPDFNVEWLPNESDDCGAFCSLGQPLQGAPRDGCMGHRKGCQALAWGKPIGGPSSVQDVGQTQAIRQRSPGRKAIGNPGCGLDSQAWRCFGAPRRIHALAALRLATPGRVPGRIWRLVLGDRTVPLGASSREGNMAVYRRLYARRAAAHPATLRQADSLCSSDKELSPSSLHHEGRAGAHPSGAGSLAGHLGEKVHQVDSTLKSVS